MQSTRIERADARDADRLTALVQSSGAYRGRYHSIIDGYRLTPEYVERHQVFMSLDAPGGLLGFYALVLDPPELDLAFVADHAQGMGIGRRLVTHMVDRARSFGLREVRVVSHPPAEQFYRRLGAEPVGTVPPTPPQISWERPELRFTI